MINFERRNEEIIEKDCEEPKLKPTLTKRQRALCEALVEGWIFRNADGKLWFSKIKPIKDAVYWICKGAEKKIELNEKSFPDLPFIKWSDKEPHSVEDMLTWEVEE